MAIIPATEDAPAASADGICRRLRMLIECWLRPGKRQCCEQCAGIPSPLGADSDFSDSNFWAHLDIVFMHYIIALRQNQPLRRALQMQYPPHTQRQTATRDMGRMMSMLCGR